MTLSASSILCLAGLHFLWQGAAIAAVAWLLGSVARRFSSQAHYLVLAVGLTAMPLAFMGTTAWLASSTHSMVRIEIVEQPAAVASDADEVRPLYLLEGSAAAVESNPTPQTPLWQQLSPWLAAIYLLAVAGLSLRLLLGLSGARRLARESACVSDQRLLQFVADQCQVLHIRTVPLVAYCRDVAVPTVIGVLRPTILLPLAATTGMTSEEIETILTHELVHIRRHDQLLVLWQRIVEILFFFHPAVWLLSRRISDVREHCCDDRVISLGVEPQIYVESLLRAAELSLFGTSVKPMSSLAIALSAVDQPSRLRERILRLVDRPAPAPLKLRPTALVIGIGLLLLALAAPLAMQSFAQTDETKPAEPSQDSPMDGATQRERSDRFDALILEEFEAADRGGDSEVDPHTFIRRLYLGLTGQPPSPEELRAWTARFGSELADEVHPDRAEVTAAWSTFFGDGPAVLGGAGPEHFRPMDHRGELGSQFEVRVTGHSDGAVWGTDVYTDDSDLGTAAVHAGLVKPGEEALLIATIVKPPARHYGSMRNGVTTQDYRTFGGSFMLHKPSAVDRPHTTASELARALGVLDRLTAEQRSQAEAARAQAQVADQELARARFRLKRYIEEGAEAHVDLNEIHRTKNADCRKCHQVPAEHVTNAMNFRGKLGRQFDVEIVGSTSGSIWGTDVYTDDSNIATAAVHAGIVKPDERAIVTVTIVESPEQHEASERNGVKSGSWGNFSSSYILMRKSRTVRAPKALPSPVTASEFSGKLGRRFDVEVIGKTDGYVWGTDVYTDDSNIAMAAVHAGLVKAGERAIVTLTIVESPDQFEGSTRHGVTTSSYGSYHNSSFILQRKPEDPAIRKGIRFLQRSMDHGSGGGSVSRPTEMQVQILDFDQFGRPHSRGAEDPRRPGTSTSAGQPATNLFTPQVRTFERWANHSGPRSGAPDLDRDEDLDGDAYPDIYLYEAITRSNTAKPLTAKVRSFDRWASARVLRGEFGTQLDVEITGRTTGSVWGTDVYTDDSDIPTAAVHAGLLKPGGKGTITVTIVKSPEKYTGSTRNGIPSADWGEHPSGYILQRKQKDAAGSSSGAGTLG